MVILKMGIFKMAIFEMAIFEMAILFINGCFVFKLLELK
jgi:hypothetical protein